MVEMKLDLFKEKKCFEWFGVTPDKVKSQKSKAEIHYFSVDLKFILKARMFLL